MSISSSFISWHSFCIEINIGYDSSYSVIYNEVKKVVPIYEKLIKQYPDSAKYYLYLGSSYGLRARVALAKKDWLGVILSGYNGIKNIKIAQTLNPYLNDIYMPIGIMEYYSSISPIPIQWVANILGIESDRQVGIGHLEFAANSSKYSWIEASSVLLYFYLLSFPTIKTGIIQYSYIYITLILIFSIFIKTL